MRPSARCLFAAWAVLAAWLLLRAEGTVEAQPGHETGGTAAIPVAPLHDPARLKGAMSCSGAACHGSLVPAAGSDMADAKTIRFDEFIVWADQDPHTRAFSVLKNERSQRMIAALVANHRIADRQRAFEQVYARCLACHSLDAQVAAVSPKTEDALPEARVSEIAQDGVGCEACHGPAQQWYVDHYQPEWEKLTEAQKRERGMSHTEHLLSRARICVECHVGSPERDVDHDLIGAGHPVLKFEFSAYHDLLPPHWNEAAERQTPDYDLRLWAAGQIASAEAALRLLEARAQRAARGTPGAVWPEFSEYDCYACHHDLVPEDWRQTRGFAVAGAPSWSSTFGESKVVLPWGSWYFSVLASALGANRADAEAQAVAEALETLRRTMQSGFRPDAGTVAAQAEAALSALERWRGESALHAWADVAVGHERARVEPISGTDAARLLAPLAEGEGRAAVANWDVATQTYLALTAAGADPGGLLQDLALPEGFGSPKTFVGPVGDTARGTRESVRKQLLQSLESLEAQER